MIVYLLTAVNVELCADQSARDNAQDVLYSGAAFNSLEGAMTAAEFEHQLVYLYETKGELNDQVMSTWEFDSLEEARDALTLKWREVERQDRTVREWFGCQTLTPYPDNDWWVIREVRLGTTLSLETRWAEWKRANP